MISKDHPITLTSTADLGGSILHALVPAIPDTANKNIDAINKISVLRLFVILSPLKF